MQHKIGIYIRVSTEEQAQVIEGSLDSQKHRLRGFVEAKTLLEKNWGRIIESYVDDGVSAKNTNRPAYQRMMKDIRTGKINLILVTELSRLSRSIADFCGLLKELEKHKAKFLSIKEQFDTSTPAGEMMLFNMINLAQFERKQTSERISINFHSRALRGLVNGGCRVLGYDKDPAHPGRMIVNEEEAKKVQYIFEKYLSLRSFSQTANQLNQEGIRPKDTRRKDTRHITDGRWTVVTIQRLLKNYAYVGTREINKLNKDENPNDLKTWHQYQLVKASWPAIISEEVFNKVQEAIEIGRDNERKRLSQAEKRVFIASNLLCCGHCGRALIGQAAHGRNKVHRYYGHKLAIGETLACPFNRIPAQKIEDAIKMHLDEVILSEGYLDKIEANIQKSMGVEASVVGTKKVELQKSLIKITAEVDQVFKLLTDFSSDQNCSELIREKLKTLADKKKELEEELEYAGQYDAGALVVKDAIQVIENRVTDYQRGEKKATPALRKHLIRRVFKQIVVTSKRLNIYYVKEENSQDAGTTTNKKGTLGLTPGVPYFKNILPFGILAINGSPIVTNGGR